jgi:hypothetical protein
VPLSALCPFRRRTKPQLPCLLLLFIAGGEVDYTEHIAPLRAAAPASMRCVLVSATLPQHTFDELQELFMGLGAAFGPGLHRTAQGENRRGHMLSNLHASSVHLSLAPNL